MATFGFSVGDFVTCLQLIREVVQALNDSKGSVSEYKSLFQTLVSLNQSLAASELVYLQWNTGSTGPNYKKNGVDMINGMLFERQKCKELMETFLKAFQPYTDVFIEERGKAVVRNWRKVTWLFQKEQVAKLETELQRHLQALRMYTDAIFQNQMAANARTMGSQVATILSDVASLRTDFSIVVKALQTWDSPMRKGLGYPWEASASLSDNVLLLDATGRSIMLPMLFLSSPVVLHDLLNIMYRGIPGHRRILRREYNITDEDSGGTLVETSNWNSIVRPGMQLSLNIVLKASRSWNVHRCPRCGEAVLGQSLEEKRRRCQKCQLTFRIFDRERVVEESEVARDTSSTDAVGAGLTPEAGDAPSAGAKSQFESRKKREITEDYFFQRIHYQRDIEKVNLTKATISNRQKDSRKFVIDELPPLHRAAARCKLAEIEPLLDRGEDINAALSFQAVICDPVTGEFYFQGCTPLQLAAFFGKAKAINLLLDRGASLLAKDRDKTDALLYAIWGEDPGVAIELLARGADVHTFDTSGRTALHAASTLGISWLVRFLLRNGADPAAQDRHGDTPQHDAARLGHENVLQILIDSGPGISTRNNGGYDLLNEACLHGQENIASILLDLRADIATRDIDGDTPLHNASWAGNEKLVRLLLEKGADVTSRDYVGHTPLHYACRRNHTAAVKLLLEYHSDMYSENQYNCDPIKYASCSGGVEALKALFEHGLDITRCSLAEYPPLHVASYHGMEKAVVLLIEKGLGIESEDNHGVTPLQYAAMRGHAQLVTVLLNMGASHSHQDVYKRTPLHCASIDGNGEVAKLLLKSGADHTIRDIEGFDSLLGALWNRNESVAKALLEHGVSLVSRDCYENTPLHVAACCGLDNMVKMLLDAGADVHAPGANGRLALHKAAFWGHDSVVETLLSRGTNPNMADVERRVPLYEAAYAGFETTVRLLLEHGADPALQCITGATPLHIAAQQGHSGVVRILLETGTININAQDGLGRTALYLATVDKSTEIGGFLLEHGADTSIRDDNGDTAEDVTTRNDGVLDLPVSNGGI